VIRPNVFAALLLTLLPVSATSLVSARAHAVNARGPAVSASLASPGGNGAARRLASITPKSDRDKESLPRARTGDELPPPADNDRDRARILHIQEVLRDIVHGATLNRLRVGMRVVEARSGRLLFGRRGATLMDPASNQKVLATATAIMRLGSDWRFRTELTGPEPDADGVIKGDVYLRGSGDPTMRSPDLEAMAQRLARRGVRRIQGAVIADTRRIGVDDAVIDAASDASGGGDSSERSSANARPPLVVNRGFMQVRVRPGSAGSFPEITTTPNDDSFEIRNSARTRTSGGSKINVDVSLDGTKIRVDVSGAILVGQLGFVFRRKVPHQALYAASLLRASLIQAGVQVLEPARVGTTPAGASLIERHESEPLGILLRKINKDSDNDQAERVLEAAGAEVYGGAPTPDKGVRLLREVIGELGLTPGSYVSRNGSGLGHANRITAEAMASLLRALYLDPRIGPEILQSLSVGGVDGTTRNRFKGSPAAKHVRAKTGTLIGNSCLSGYVGDGSDVLVFSILVEGLSTKGILRAVRGAQVGAVNAMMRYVREGAGEKLDAPGFNEPDTAPDYENGDESFMETDGEMIDGESTTKAGEDPVDAVLRKEHVSSPSKSESKSQTTSDAKK
jgi:D-alanyl-D-alanine carboxypeptidase/D-alanyl-D-alanine-endopeptidase (penicillin-binding protein 4)